MEDVASMNATVTPAPSSLPHLVVVAGNRMSEAEYDAERARLRELYGESSAEAVGKRDQALALLFARSNWTQEELAKKEGKTRQWIAYRVRFGEFLNYATVVAKSKSLPSNLTEGRFRKFWEQTDKKSPKDEYRFREVLELLNDPEAGPQRTMRPRIAPDIVKQFGDGKWHQVEVIAKALGTDADHVDGALGMMLKYTTHGASAEKRIHSRSHQYRIFKQDRAIANSELLEKLTPIVKGLEAEGRRSAAAASPAAVAILANQLRKLLDEWTQ